MIKPRIRKPLKYPQTALTGANPKEQHYCKQPCTQKFGGSNRRLFGFWNPSNARPSPGVVITLDE